MTLHAVDWAIIVAYLAGMIAVGYAVSGRIRAFRDRLANQGVEATVRRSRGLDIAAACGQLRTAEERRVSRSRRSPLPRS